MSEARRIIVGLCAMPKKVNSTPMREILCAIEKTSYVKMEIFSEHMILKEPIENWPICDALISFYSHNFPLDKAIAYADLRKPYLINDLRFQKTLLNRKKVYEILESHGIPVPKYIFVDRANFNYEIGEVDDALEVNGHVIHKPFVEKPVDAEDHNIYIYFPSTAGGGCQKLFRKVGDRSSYYSQESSVRQNGSFIYEVFMPTDGTDVKIYTIGDDYAHAEARKSPALDGRVERDREGKEVRYPVILTLREKMMAKKVSQAFKQRICGFDLLRANGMSYVCDVNGFSFVKSSPKYYEDCAHILLMLITRQIAPDLFTPKMSLPTTTSHNLVPTTSGSIMELRCVIGVIRHGDRTPKQKLKMEVKHEKFFRLFSKYAGDRITEVKLKKPKQMQEFLDIIRQVLLEAEENPESSKCIKEQCNKFIQIRNVLEMYGNFSGINRKIQIKKKTQSDCPEHMFNFCNCEPFGLLLVVKWGGELTKAGKLQAEKLGKAFRRLYPSGNGDYDDDSGLGLLRLHSTYRHDLKIYASDEGRVQMTAAAFAKGFLALEGELPPIIVSMVKSANTNGLLDNDNDCRQYQVLVKKKIYEVMSQNRMLNERDFQTIAATNTPSLVSALRHIGNPVKMCDLLLSFLINLNLHLNEFSTEEKASMRLYHDESWDLLLRRWRKLLKDFKPKDTYELSKISDIYDNIKYDIQHNPNILIEDEATAFFACAKALADVIIPQEYGVTVEEKLVIGQRICTPLLRKILCDAKYTDVDECTRLHAGYSKGVASPERFVRTRLYFTSESHLHSLINCIRYGDLANVKCDEQWKRAMDYVNYVSELNYLSQIVIMIFEDPTQSSKTAKNRFHVEIHFSPGAFTSLTKPVEGTGYRPKNLERNQVSNKSSSTNSKVISRSSSTNEKPDSKIQSADEEKESVFNVRDLLNRLSRKKKSRSANRETFALKSSSNSTSGDPPWLNDSENAKCDMAISMSSASNDDDLNTPLDTPSKFTVTTVQNTGSEASIDGTEIKLRPANLDSIIPKNIHIGRKGMSQREEDEEFQEFNYLTYPSSDLSMINCSARNLSSSRPLISTNVIMGARHHSSIPDFNNYYDISDDGTRNKNLKNEMIVPSAPCVPEIHSLETLHNALNLSHIEKFLIKLVSQKLPTPSASPK